MAAKKKTTEAGTLASIGDSLKSAAQSVVDKADEYVVQPVGNALGLTEEKKPEPEMTSSEKKRTRKAAVKAATAKTTRKRKPAST